MWPPGPVRVDSRPVRARVGVVRGVAAQDGRMADLDAPPVPVVAVGERVALGVAGVRDAGVPEPPDALGLGRDESVPCVGAHHRGVAVVGPDQVAGRVVGERRRVGPDRQPRLAVVGERRDHGGRVRRVELLRRDALDEPVQGVVPERGVDRHRGARRSQLEPPDHVARHVVDPRVDAEHRACGPRVRRAPRHRAHPGPVVRVGGRVASPAAPMIAVTWPAPL